MAKDANKLQSARNTGAQAQDTERLLLLSQALHASLDPDRVIQNLFVQIAAWLKLDGLNYRLPEQAEAIQLGHPGRHSCDYRLGSEQTTLGQYIFSRNHRFTESERATLEHWLSFLIVPLSNALEHRHALRMTKTDSLTGLGNRAALDAALEREVGLTRRHRLALSMLVVDVDHFKKVNDRYGHSEGDRVLKAVAHRIQMLCRESDLVFRYGGEEFVVLLNKTERAGARVIAERIRQGVEALGVAGSGDKTRCPITVSVGISSWNQQTASPSELFDRADHALYKAKTGGRNRVVLESSSWQNIEPGGLVRPRVEPIKAAQSSS